LNEAEQVIQQGEITIDAPWSCYDRVSTTLPEDRVSEAQKVYFALTKEVRRVRIQAVTGPALVTAYTRPPDSPKLTRVPQDYAAAELGTIATRTWFLIRPDQYMRALESGRGWSLRIQPRPPDDRLELATENLEWESITPSGFWLARSLLVPRDPGVPIRDQARQTIYSALPTGDTVTARLVNAAGFRFQPRLIYRGEDGIAQQVGLFVNGSLFQEIDMRSRQGEIDLDRVPDSERESSATLHVQSQGRVRIFLNGLDAPHLPTYSKRLAQKLGDGPLEFQYTKASHEAESLTLNFYSPPQATETVRVRVRIETPERATNTPAAEWTVADRLFVISPGSKDASLVLNANGDTVDEGRACYFSLDRDLSAGPYSIRVEQLDGAPGYVVLTRATMSLAPVYEVWRETHDFATEN
jgi:hypothetical protein